jgi:AraC-like DNA-binding protein
MYRSDLEVSEQPGTWPTVEMSEQPDTWPADAASGAWGHDEHAHSYGQLVYAITGEATFSWTGENGAGRVDCATALWFPPRLPHAARFAPGFVPLLFEFDLPGPVTAPLSLVVDRDLRASLLQEVLEGGGAAVERLRDRLRRAAGTPGGDATSVIWPTGPLTRPIADALREDPADERTLEDWAAHLHTSVVSIRRAFPAETGLAFTQWRTRVRLSAALAPLRDGQPVTRVAHAVGFSHNGFLAAFRRHFACAPSEVARRSAAAPLADVG